MTHEVDTMTARQRAVMLANNVLAERAKREESNPGYETTREEILARAVLSATDEHR